MTIRKGNAALIISFILAAVIVIGIIVLLSGPSNIIMGKVKSLPNFYGLDREDALLTAQQIGIIVKIDSINDNNLPYSIIVKQNPLPGKSLTKGDIIYLTLNNKELNKFAIPDFRNMLLNDVEKEIGKLGLVLGEIKKAENKSLEPNSVISQMPAPGTIIEKGDKIDLTIASKPKIDSRIKIPNVKGKYYTAARKILIDRGFKVLVRYKINIEYDFDLVLDQYPSAGTNAKKGTTVTIYVNHEE
jgi:serine/threonine-protein kinase